jgi:4-hydroxy-tetrahydrodipicolinate synthase
LEDLFVELKVEGIIPAMVTPLDENDELDEEGMREVVNFLIEARVHGLFVCGSQGESYALSEDEKKKAVRVIVDEVNGRIPVYVGTGAVTTKDVIRMSQYAADVGADAVSIVTPYFIRPTQYELYMHYKRITESLEIPVLLYNNPGRTDVNLEAKTVKRLASNENIIGIKDSSGDLTLTAEYIHSCPTEFSVLAGKDSLIFATLMYGGKGAIAATANVVPEIVVGIYENYMRGDFTKARELQFKLLPLRLAFNLGTFPTVIKEAMRIVGKPAGKTRNPVMSLSEEKRAILETILHKLDLLHS